MLIFLNLVSLAVTVTSGLPQRDALPCFVREEGSKEPAYCQVQNIENQLRPQFTDKNQFGQI
jgi:hypothetical protein